jgi:hypothetical protein
VCEQGRELLREGTCFPFQSHALGLFPSYKGLRLSNLELNSGVLQFEHIDIDCRDIDEVNSQNYVKPKSMETILTGTLTYVPSFMVKWNDGCNGNRVYLTVTHVCTLRYTT